MMTTVINLSKWIISNSFTRYDLSHLFYLLCFIRLWEGSFPIQYTLKYPHPQVNISFQHYNLKYKRVAHLGKPQKLMSDQRSAHLMEYANFKWVDLPCPTGVHGLGWTVQTMAQFTEAVQAPRRISSFSPPQNNSSLGNHTTHEIWTCMRRENCHNLTPICFGAGCMSQT